MFHAKGPRGSAAALQASVFAKEVFRMRSQASGPLLHHGPWPGESADTRKDPHRIRHGILRPLVNGTQRLLQSNLAGRETALIKEADNQA